MTILSNITTHKSQKILDALNKLGAPGNVVINSSNRQIAWQFFNGIGFSFEHYRHGGADVIATAYNSFEPNGGALGLIPYVLKASPQMPASDIAETLAICIQRSGLNIARATTSEVESYIAANNLRSAVVPVTATTEAGNAPAVVAPSNAVLQATIAQAGNPDAAMTQAAGAIASLLAAMSNKPAELDETKVIALIKQHSMATSVVITSDTGKWEVPTGVHHKKLPEVIKYLSAGVNVFMVGAAGSGKTTIAEKAAHALNLPFYFNGALDSEYKLTGFIDAQGRIVSTAFRKAYETGGVYLFDEVDASMPSALLAFNAALANGHSDFPDGCIKKHEKFLCIAAANTFGKGADRLYVGRNQLDAATMDRFAVIEVDYDEKLERALAGNDDWVDYVQSIRKAVFALKIRHVVSPRASINGAKLLAAGIARDNVIDSVIWKGLDKDSITKIKAQAA